ncbi:DUF2339 domain-containing protein [Thalassotalea euphylliae]|uniref:DUF2339 domain-containing protein n=1 Tax=Thalassotalea euphylliae TaxID=1655234 RepID=A0A3E0TZ27_9GAMM|nr:DUF2339 domain-containing protein [Thalassotalea euphylliae]REL29245.1 DUF2339 domain-containing protein [Thalassotalea euphylliae]
MDKEIEALKAELASLEADVNQRFRAMESRLNSLARNDVTAEQGELASVPETSDNSVLHHKQIDSGQTNTESSFSFSSSQSPIPHDSSETSKIHSKETTADGSHTQLAQASKTKSYFSIWEFLQPLLFSIFDWLSPLVNAYESYKSRGMLGIVFLTIAGVGLTLAGFGYLMQLLIDQLGVGAKSLLMALAAIGVIGLGIGLRLKTCFSEFATAIVMLGLLLAYSTVYFTGSVYGLIPSLVVLFLYFVVAIVCHGLALWLGANLVAGMGIIGIATMPILSNTVQVESLYYLLSLLFIAGSSLLLAYRKAMPWLANVCLAFCVLALEWVIGIEETKVSAFAVNLFYLLFFAYTSLVLSKPLDNVKQSNSILIFFAALIGAVVLLFWQSSGFSSTAVAASFLLNFAAAIAVSTMFYRIKLPYTHFFVLSGVLWAVLTVVSLVSDSYWGIAWAAEGILLLYLGRQYLMPNVVNQGQVLIGLSLGYCWFGLAPYFPTPALQTADGWLLSTAIIATIGIWQRLITQASLFGNITTQRVKPALQLIEVVWLSVLLVSSLSIWIGNWTGAVIILWQLAVLMRAKQCRQASIEGVAVVLILVALFYVNVGAQLVNSYRFTALPLFAQLALVSAFIQLWLWAEFYRRAKVESKLIPYAENARILFYLLLPICWIGTATRRLDEDVLALLWLSPMIAHLLAHKLKQDIIVKEAKLLTLFTSLLFIGLIAVVEPILGLFAIAGFAILYGVAFYIERQAIDKALEQYICSWGIVSLSFALPIYIASYTNSMLIGVLLGAVIWLTHLVFIKYSSHLMRNERLIVAVVGMSIILAWGLTFVDALYALVPMAFLLASWQRKGLLESTLIGRFFGENTPLLLHALGAVSYVVTMLALASYRFDLLIAPSLAIHGALILFLQDKRLVVVKFGFSILLLGIAKLAIIDAANALLWQKVILFMGIGAFILVASFWYQRLSNKEAGKADELNKSFVNEAG